MNCSSCDQPFTLNTIMSYKCCAENILFLDKEKRIRNVLAYYELESDDIVECVEFISDKLRNEHNSNVRKFTAVKNQIFCLEYLMMNLFLDEQDKYAKQLRNIIKKFKEI